MTVTLLIVFVLQMRDTFGVNKGKFALEHNI